MIERLDVFMARANAAYYARHDPFADFTTAPEISQVFGELLGLWCAVTWEAMGRPDPVRLIEAGPGRGTLMADALRAARRVAPTFATALRVHFVETSQRLRERQRTVVPDASWHDDVSEVPAGPLILLANEFLDALPIRQFVRSAEGWAERYVNDGAFELVVCNAPSPHSSPEDGRGGDVAQAWLQRPLSRAAGEGRGEGAAIDEIRELNEHALAFTADIAQRLAREGGAALLLDYGPEHSVSGDSLQALRDGKPADPLADPGEADLTAHVDFAALAEAARDAGAVVHGPLPQGIFLARLGLFQRTDRLARTQTPGRAVALIEAAQRLAEPGAMGRLFKAMAITHPDLPAPAGFLA